jgi:hypothetical protein
MATLITTIDEVRQFATVSANMDIDNLAPHLDLIEEREIIPALGAAQFATITGTGLSGVLAQLQKLARRALVNLALYEGALGDFKVVMGDGGLRQEHSSNLKPAFERDTRDYIQDKFLKGYQALDAMLVFLEENENESALAPWKSSSAYTKYKELFLPSAADFKKYYSLVQSRYLFIQLRPDLEAAQEGEIADTLLPTLYNTLKSTWADGTISADNRKLIPLIQRAMAHLTIANGLNKLAVKVDQRGITVYQSSSTDTVEQAIAAEQSKTQSLITRAQEEAALSLKRLTQFLQANIADYADYANDPAYNADAPVVKGGISSELGRIYMI